MISHQSPHFNDSVDMYLQFLSDVRTNHNWTALHNACFRGRLEVVKYLVEELKCDVGES